MKRTLIAFAVVAVALVAMAMPGASLAAPPSNDDFTNATVIGAADLPYSATVVNTEATTEANEPLQCIAPPPEKTVWYSFTPSADVVLRADTSGSDFSSFLEVFRSDGPGLGGLSGLQCQFFGNPVIFSATAGTTYLFQAAAFPFNNGGNLQFHLAEIPAPANDDFEDAAVVPSLPYSSTTDTQGADVQSGEPGPSCASVTGSVWYAFTPSVSGSVSARAQGNFSTVIAAYTGASVAGLSEVGCRAFGGRLTIPLEAGTTYYFQAGGLFGGRGSLRVDIEVTPAPVAGFSRNIWDPSSFDTVQFWDSSFDPGEIGIESASWDFGDGATAQGCCPTHRYPADGDYTVTLDVTTFDGRTASTEQSIPVRTHDIAITKLSVPQSANAGQTRQLTVGLSNKRYDERVQVQLFKSGPNGYELVGTLQQSVPVRGGGRTTDLKLSYTFTSTDAALGKVTFKAVAGLLNARDALPADNEAVALPTKVNG